jgi:hypothetical protein
MLSELNSQSIKHINPSFSGSKDFVIRKGTPFFILPNNLSLLITELLWILNYINTLIFTPIIIVVIKPQTYRQNIHWWYENIAHQR